MVNHILKHYTLLNTRPKSQASQLTLQLESLGCHVIEWPLLEIFSVPFIMPPPKFYHALIFTSANAVKYFFDRHPIEQVTYRFIIAIGQGTAKELEDRKIHVDFLPAEANSTHILRLPCLKNIPKTHVLLIKGYDGLTYIQEHLRQQDVTVDVLAVYQRKVPNYTTKQWKELWLNQKIDLIIITSLEAYEYLKQQTHRQGIDLYHIPLWVISERVAQEARKYHHTVLVSHYKDCISTIKDYFYAKKHQNT